MAFYAYMLVCSDGSYYTGHTENLEVRVAQHQRGLASRHTKSRRPVRLVWSQDFTERYEALAAEQQIKGWSRAKKEALIDKRWDELSRLSKSKSPLRQAQGERVTVSQDALDTVNDHAASAHPNEACGLLLGDGNAITQALPTPNVHPTPLTHFEVDPHALIDAHRAEREGGLKVLGYFHSHPTGDPHPSDTDRAMSAGDGKVWAIIGAGIAGETVKFWLDTPDGFHALSYDVASR